MLFITALLYTYMLSGNPIECNNAWIRPAAKNANTAMYCEVVNNGNEVDTLYNVTSDISRKTEIHETYKQGDMMGMRHVDFIVVKPHEKVSLQPGGFHVMLIGTKNDVKKGEHGEVSFHFKKAGVIKVKGIVKEN